MKNIFTNLTLEKINQLKMELGESNPYVLNTLEFSISTDRSESGIPTSIMNMAKRLQKIADIIECDVSVLEMKFNYEQSDHEVATHVLDLNPDLSVGSYCLFRNELCFIESVYSGVYSIQNVKTKETQATSVVYLERATLADILMIRDNVLPEDLY